MLSRHPSTRAVALTCCLALGGCQDGSPLSPDDAARGGTLSLAAAATLEEVCVPVDFDGLAHGDVIGTVSVPELELAFDVAVWPSNGGLSVARAYDTDVASPPGDAFLAWSGGDAACAACGGLGRVLVIEDGAGFATGGASDYGGTFFVSGFTQAGVWIRSATAVNAAEYEGSHQIYVDAEPMASSAVADGAVQAMTPVSETPIVDFVELVILAAARGGFDDVVMCRMMETAGDDAGTLPEGGEGCGPGFWKNPRHAGAWEGTGLSPADGLAATLGAAPAAFLRPEQRVDPGALTLAGALALRGPGVNQLARQSAAAVLNAASPDLSYDLRVEDVLARYADALSGGDASGTAAELAAFNEQTCPLD